MKHSHEHRSVVSREKVKRESVQRGSRFSRAALQHHKILTDCEEYIPTLCVCVGSESHSRYIITVRTELAEGARMALPSVSLQNAFKYVFRLSQSCIYERCGFT